MVDLIHRGGHLFRLVISHQAHPHAEGDSARAWGRPSSAPSSSPSGPRSSPCRSAILGAVYVVEYGAANRLSGVIRFMSDVMAGVPSIVMGLFIYTIFTLRYGLRGFGGSLALACLMLPIVIRSTETMLRLVPSDQREASRALGASQSRTILTVVLPAALPGITSGCLLAVARAAGETAPLLFTIGVISLQPNWNVFSGPNTALSAQIFNLAASSPYIGGIQRAWTAALTLIVMVLILTVAARLITSRFSVGQAVR